MSSSINGRLSPIPSSDSRQEVNPNNFSPIQQKVDEKVNIIRQIIDKTSYDAFGNCLIDLSSSKDFPTLQAEHLKSTFPAIFEAEKKNTKHVLIMKLSPSQTSLYEPALNAGMIFHHADHKEAVLTKCLKDHDIEKCTYPKYKTASVGITGVVFNGDLSKFLAIKEVSGPYKGWKAPTGAVDYNTKGETPLEAAVREISEETNLKLESKDALFVGNKWTKDFRGNSPDINYVFAFKCTDLTQKLHPQEEEISKVEWISVKEFLETPANVKNESTFVIKKAIEAALKAIQTGNSWTPKDLNWGSGKPVTLFSNL